MRVTVSNVIGTLFVMLSLAACSAGSGLPPGASGGQTTMSIPSSARYNLGAVQSAVSPPLSLKTITSLRPDSTQQLNSGPAQLDLINKQQDRKLLLWRGKRVPEHVTQGDPNTHAEGVEFPEYYGAYHNQGIQTNITVYNGWSVPSGTHDGYPNAVFSPTVKGPRTCLEVSMQYQGGTEALRVFSFCDNNSNGAYVLSKSIDATFESDYVRYLNGDTIPQVTIYTISFDPNVVQACDPQAPGYQCDVAAIYNYNTDQFEVIYAENEGNTDGWTDGWDQFETHLPSGDCLSIPVFGSTYTYEYQSPSDGESLASSSYGAYDFSNTSDPCFSQATGVNGYYYIWDDYGPLFSWKSWES